MKNLFKLSRPQWCLWSLIVVGSLLSGYLNSLDIAPWYRGSAKLRLHPERLVGFQFSNDVDTLGNSGGMFLNTVVESAANTELMLQVIEEHDLISNVQFAGPHAGPQSIPRLARMLAMSTRARSRPDTWLFDISVGHSDRDLVKDLVNWIAEAMVEQQAQILAGYSDEKRDRLRAAIKEAQQNLRKAEIALLELRRTTGALGSASLQAELRAQSISSLHERWRALQMELAEVEDWIALIEGLGDSPSIARLLAIPEIRYSDDVRFFTERLRELEGDLDLQRVVGESTGKLQTTEALLTVATERRDQAVRSAVNELESRVEVLSFQERQASQRLREAKEELLLGSSTDAEVRVLERNVDEAFEHLASLQSRERQLIELGESLRSPLSIVEKEQRASDLTADPNTMIVAGLFYGILFASLLVGGWRYVYGKGEDKHAATKESSAQQ